jgi:hypothetical protein
VISASRTRSIGSGRSRITWQRETTVGHRSSTARAVSSSVACGGGSSSVLSNALAAAVLAVSNLRRIATRCRASTGVSATSRSNCRTWSTLISSVTTTFPPICGVTICTSGCLSAAMSVHARQCPHGGAAPVQFSACA